MLASWLPFTGNEVIVVLRSAKKKEEEVRAKLPGGRIWRCAFSLAHAKAKGKYRKEGKGREEALRRPGAGARPR